MADMQEAIRRLKYLYEVHGADQVAAAQAAITASTTATEKASLSLEKSFNNMERRYVATVRAQQDYQRVQEKVNAAVAQNPALQARGNVILEHAEQQYMAASRGLNTYGKALDQTSQQGRLARHELINLSRQFQDVGVGIVSGQSPFTILVQQGAQIADVFATSTGTIGGFFKQVGAGAARFAASTGGIVTGVVAIGASIGYVATSYASGQRDIERSLSGIGRASGVTRDQINQIGQTSSSAFGLSASEAREAATAFAATGKIYQDNVAAATSIVNDFARGGGDATEMTKKLAAALLDPAKGALDLNKELGFLDATTLDYIRTLQAAGKLQEAQAVLMRAAAPAIQEQAKHVGLLTQAWNAATNAISNYISRKGKEILQQVERATGATPGGISGFSQNEQLARFTEQLDSAKAKWEEMRAKFGEHPLGEHVLRQAAADVSRLEGIVRQLEKAKKEADEKLRSAALKQLGVEATLAADAIMPVTAEIRKLEEGLNKIRQYRAATGGPVTGAEQVGAVRLQELKEQEAATVRVAQATQKIAEMYPGMTIDTAKQLHALQQQLPVSQARTGAEKLVAQEIATQNQLMAQGKTPAEAMAIAAAERANKQAEINAQAQLMLMGLRDQFAVVSALTGQERMRAQQVATFNSLVRQGVDGALAAAIAEQERVNAQAQLNAGAQNTLWALQQQYTIVSAITGIEKMRAQQAVTFNTLVRQGVDEYYAMQVAAQEFKNAQAGAITQIIQQIKAMEDQTALIYARMDGSEAAVKAEQAYTKALEATGNMMIADAAHAAAMGKEEAEAAEKAQRARQQAADAIADANKREAESRRSANNEWDSFIEKLGFVPHLAAAMGAKLFESKQGGYSQFDPKGYVSSHPSMLLHSLVTQMQLGQRKFVGTGFDLGPGNYQLTPQGFEDLIINQVLKRGGGITGAIGDVFSEIGRGAFGQEQAGILQRLIDVLPKEDQAAQIKRVIAQVQQQPVTLAREELLKQLNDQLKGLTDSVDALNGALSPYYSQDPRTTKLGFRAGVAGNPDWMTGASNKTALDVILGKGATAPGGITSSQITPYTEEQLRYRREHGITTHGMASGGSFVVGGGYSATDNKMARFPVASGEQVVVNRRPQDQRPIVVHNDNRIIVQGALDQDTLSKLKVSRYQQTQRMRNAMSAG